eukprot:scaffold90639_cov66-Phaeocystis_antarctica.AAC.16
MPVTHRVVDVRQARIVELPDHALLERLVPVLDKVLDLVERADAERIVRTEELPTGQRLSRAIWLDGRNAADKLRIALTGACTSWTDEQRIVPFGLVGVSGSAITLDSGFVLSNSRWRAAAVILRPALCGDPGLRRRKMPLCACARVASSAPASKKQRQRTTSLATSGIPRELMKYYGGRASGRWPRARV